MGNNILGLEHQGDLQPSILQAGYVSLSIMVWMGNHFICNKQFVLQILAACNYFLYVCDLIFITFSLSKHFVLTLS